MMIATLASVTIMLHASLGGTDPFALPSERAIERMLDTTTSCIAQVVRGNIRYRVTAADIELSDIIAESVPFCAGLARRLIDALDQRHGVGEGEKFFMGPYLDRLPHDVKRKLEESAGP